MHALLGVFGSFSLLSVRLLSLLNLNFRAGYTFKSRMCRGIVGDVFLFIKVPGREVYSPSGMSLTGVRFKARVYFAHRSKINCYGVEKGNDFSRVRQS